MTTDEALEEAERVREAAQDVRLKLNPTWAFYQRAAWTKKFPWTAYLMSWRGPEAHGEGDTLADAIEAACRKFWEKMENH
jgi:hypothetical protein